MHSFTTPLCRLATFGLLLAVVAAPVAAQIEGVAENEDGFGSTVARGDFDGDGYADLAVGVPYEAVGEIPHAGAVNVIYGANGTGLTAVGDQIWHQDSPGVNGAAAAYERFGAELAAGDFDGDGRDDLAITAVYDVVGGVTAGAVNVLYGSNAGLTTAGAEYWTQNSTGIPDVAETDEGFGAELAAGDFDDDGFADLAIGVPGESVGGLDAAGAVHVLYGSAGAGLTADGDDFWHQSIPDVEDVAEENDWLGGGLAMGDFDADGVDDLAIGAPGENVGSISNVGIVHVLYGEPGAGLIASGDQFWRQGAGGIQGVAEYSDQFGSVLAVGDFDADGADDLAIGVSNESVGDLDRAGAVNVLYGANGTGLTAAGNQIWHQDSPGIAGSATARDSFGWSLAAGDFDDDGFDDLTISAPFEDGLNGPVAFGVVHVLYGAAGVGLTQLADQFWSQNAPGVLDEAEDGDTFGHGLAAGDFDGDGYVDLAIGTPGESPGNAWGAGAVNVLYGDAGAGLNATGDQLWHQSVTASAPDPLAGDEAPPMEAAASGAEAPATSALLPAAPNPFRTRTAVRFELAEPGTVRLAVYDLLGREVALLVDGAHEAGRFTAALDGSALPAGVYLVRLTTASGLKQTHRVTLAR